MQGHLYASFILPIMYVYPVLNIGSTCASVSAAHSSPVGQVLRPHHEDSCKETGPETVSVSSPLVFLAFCRPLHV